MIFHIHTHNAYAIASLISLTLGGFCIANHLYDRYMHDVHIQLIDVNFALNVFVVLMGSAVVAWYSLFSWNLRIELMSACAGIFIGYICLSIESYVISLLRRNGHGYLMQNQAPTKSINNLLKKKPNERINRQQPYFSTIMVGLLEEVLYRGYLTALCMSFLSTTLSAIALIAITLVFALNHINLGNIHILTKGLLGSICLLSFLITKTILTPIFIHGTFNALVINKYRKLNYA